jgi:hypothetical protein
LVIDWENGLKFRVIALCLGINDSTQMNMSRTSACHRHDKCLSCADAGAHD